jgi:hypothetical protein
VKAISKLTEETPTMILKSQSGRGMTLDDIAELTKNKGWIANV